MSYDEAVSWAEYRNKRGSLNSSIRIEEMIALLISIMTALHAKEPQPPHKFMPYIHPEEYVFAEEKPIKNPPPEVAFALLKSLTVKSKQRREM